MILVHLVRSWPDVLAGERSADDATLGEWAQLSDSNIDEYGDILIGIYENSIVSAYEIDGHYRDRESKRVTFKAHETSATREFLGRSNPGRQWGRRGDARPVQALPTSDLLDPPVEAPVQGLEEPRLRYREATAKRKGAWITDYPDGLNVTRWDDGTIKVGMWDHRLVLIDPKPRNYRAGKSRGAGLIRMRFEPLDEATAD
ncbi:hypothetical protein [Pseudonocardia alni]|uniref:hypothetical protein n=1 Tax=Pseudonocardia alni TaxID=33907 RepID=UPI0027A5CAB0|nr:hypothetical protein PaSha_08870 [Pseudonocardia alni]